MIGVAAKLGLGKELAPGEFFGGKGPDAANTVLESLGFTIERKAGSCPLTQVEDGPFTLSADQLAMLWDGSMMIPTLSC